MVKKVKEYIAKLKNKSPTRSNSTGLDDHEKLMLVGAVLIVTLIIFFILTIVLTSKLSQANQVIADNEPHHKKNHTILVAKNNTISDKNRVIVGQAAQIWMNEAADDLKEFYKKEAKRLEKELAEEEKKALIREAK